MNDSIETRAHVRGMPADVTLNACERSRRVMADRASELVFDETGICRLAALKYALELINEREIELGIPLADPAAHPNYDGHVPALIRFVILKADEIGTANLHRP
jgi:hypothetical protein